MGSKVLEDLMNTHFVVSLTYNKDPIEMAFNEGQRSVVLRILKYLKEDIKAIEKRIEEVERGSYE
jgi:hypothetical protein